MPDEYVQVPVPSRWVAAIYRRLAELAEEESGGSAASTGAKDPSEITPELLLRMWDESHEPHRELMSILAANPGASFTTSQLAEKLGLEYGAKSLAGMLGAFQRRSNNRYGGLTPWISQWDYKLEESRHSMPPEWAQVLREYTGEDPEAVHDSE